MPAAYVRPGRADHRRPRSTDWLTDRMHVTRIGLTPLKGARHATLERVALGPSGPEGDRVFCLVEADRPHVLRTVDNPRMLLVDAAWDGSTLTVGAPGQGVVSEVPGATGEELVCDYWGRDARLEIMTSRHAQLLGRHLGREVRLARTSRRGEVVYGAPVSIVTTGALASLSEQESARFRATVTIDAERDPDPGTVLAVGGAVVRVRAAIPRCRVIDLDPTTGRLDRTHLATLAGRPRPVGLLPFGVDADVLVPGTVLTGDRVAVTGGGWSEGQLASVVPS
ncbi:MOSC N-terminal beta barrel domain-containing protein [Janibacter limosus]|nr:MOSC N-terminal beta barrel domain-containing protein [Janibacter limosus]